MTEGCRPRLLPPCYGVTVNESLTTAGIKGGGGSVDPMSLYVPADAMARSENVAHPATALTVTVPMSVPEFTAIVIGPVKLVFTFPNLSYMHITTGGAIDTPAVVCDG